MSLVVFFVSSRRRHTRCSRDWSSDVCSSDLGYELIEVVRAPIGEGGLEVGPDELVRIQVGGIAGEGLDVQPRTPGEQGANVGPLVNAAAVPEDDDGPAQLAEHGAEEHCDLHMGDVAPRIEMDVEP